SGFTARLAARYRPAVPLVALTPHPEIARQLGLVWGVRPLVAPVPAEHLEGVMALLDRELPAAGLASPGERIVVLMGHPTAGVAEQPLTNLLCVHRLRALAS
ncbi:MAG TPA: pyruvate kinase alpha/beta domain-containing protein, partial [Thermoanaerobaculia bacterium]|nr:pyruvate kinase alpha/beta domain-containing protein [Thermoanaerobaculia bacterium]